MKNNLQVMHDIPGRMRLIIPGLAAQKDEQAVYRKFALIRGVKNVRIEPLIESMIIEYDGAKISSEKLLHYVRIFTAATVKNSCSTNGLKTTRKDLAHSLLSGSMLLISYIRQQNRRRKGRNAAPDLLDYLAILSSAHTVLAHGGPDRLKHPDIIGGIVSLLSLGSEHLPQVSFISWALNLVEVLSEMSERQRRKHKAFSS